MQIELSVDQEKSRQAFRTFADEEIIPNADYYDREQRIPMELISKIGQVGYLGAIVPQESGGAGMDMITFGLLNEEIGRGCSSVRGLITVQNMVAYGILRCGSKAQKTYWLPRLADGQTIAAFGLTEPDIGSDARSVETNVVSSSNNFRLNGTKKWISFGQIADLFLILAQENGNVSAFLVERGRPGFSARSISGMLGTRASMLAELEMCDCEIPRENLVGGSGFGWATVAATALDIGRYSVGWGCVGISQACLEASLEYSGRRKQFGAYLKDHQLIQRMLAEMIANTRAARLLCYRAGYLKDIGDPNAIVETCIAKYFAAMVCAKAASDAVQIHGANGCSDEFPVQRYYRDAKVMEIIEGSREIQQLIIAKHGFR